MLITKTGCCGRYSTIVTNLDVQADSPLEEEYCLYKKNGTCGVCVQHCPSGALTFDGFNRYKCYDVCKKMLLFTLILEALTQMNLEKFQTV